MLDVFMEHSTQLHTLVCLVNVTVGKRSSTKKSLSTISSTARSWDWQHQLRM